MIFEFQIKNTVLPPPLPEGGDRDITGPVPDEDKRAMQELVF